MFEVARDVGHRHDEKVSERVTIEGALFEAVVEELLHQGLSVGQRDQALAKIAGRKDSVFIPQAARGAAVVGDGDDHRKVRGVCLESAQKTAEACAASYGHDAGP